MLEWLIKVFQGINMAIMNWAITTELNQHIEDHIKTQVRLHRFQQSPSGLFTEQGDPVDWQALYVYLHYDEHLVGALLGSTQWQTLHVSWLWIAEAHRRQGCARQMIDRAIIEAKRRGCSYAWGTVWGTQGAAAFYDKLGARLMWRQEYPVPGHALLYYRYDFD